MTKQEYLQRLRALLRSLPHQEVERICTFYAESIDDRMESGLSESDAVASMETPGTVAEQIIDSMPAVPRLALKAHNKFGILFWALLLIGSPLWVPLVLTAIAVVIALYMTMRAIVLAAWAVAASLIVMFVACIVAAVFAVGSAPTSGLLLLTGKGALCGAAGLLGIAVCGALTWVIAKASIGLAKAIARPFIHAAIGNDDNTRAPRNPAAPISGTTAVGSGFDQTQTL